MGPTPGSLPRLLTLTALAALLAMAPPVRAQEPAGELTVAFHVTIAPTWLDPSTAPPHIPPFGVLLAGQKRGPSLAESGKESPDGLVYEFKLRRGLTFHNGDPITAEDVKFSYDRYQGAGAREFRARVREVQVVDPLTV